MKIAVYTRVVEPDTYTSCLGNSIHFALSNDGIHYQALNYNYGILFAKAIIDENNTIQVKGVKRPHIIRTREGLFVITATRVNTDGSEDEEGNNKTILWTSIDLIHYSEEQFVDLQKEEKLLSVDLHEGKTFIPELPDIAGAIPGNAIDVEKEIVDALLIQWTPLENKSIHVPDTITVSCRKEIESVMALASYSDGSTISKKVLWNTGNVDFLTSGTYEVEGTVLRNNYDFPLAKGYADPDIIQWEDNYYFIATNDRTDNKGFYVRKADSVEGLFSFDIKEYLVLDVDPVRHLVQTFWAPEFHVIGGELYLLFAVSGEVWGPQSHMMKLKKGGNILNPDDWENPIRVIKKDGSFLADGSDITLDMTYFSLEKDAYLVWSYRSHIGTPLDSGSMLFIATIDPNEPWVLTSGPVLLSRPLFGWENNDQTINNEGPFALITDQYIYVIYSGGAAGGYTYVLGLLTAKRGDDLLNVANWSKSNAPVLTFCSVEGEYGPGHNSFFQDENGNIMMVYHAQERLNNSPRCTGIRRIHFDINGVPKFDMSLERDLKNDLKKVFMKVIIEITKNDTE